MCQVCNDSLTAAANAANQLAQAAKTLYEINQPNESKILAKAAAELFSIIPDEVSDGAKGDTQHVNGAAESQSPGKGDPADPSTKPVESFIIGDNGVVYLNGVAIGRAMTFSLPTKH